MAIQNRRGIYSDFTPNKMVPGEFAIVQSGDPYASDGKAVYIAHQAGLAKRLAAYDEVQPREAGKGLSTNDYTTAEKNKLAGISAGAEVNVPSDWNQTNTSADDFIKNKPSIYTQSQIDSQMNGKVDKVSGKGLSANDYTDTEKTKLAGIASGAEVNVQSDWNQASSSADDFIKNKPTKTSDFTNDGDGESDFATEAYVQENGGKIDTISVNGTTQPITDKNVDIPVPVIDSTLTQTGKAADAKVTGDELASVKGDLQNKASVIISSASGSIAHFEDSSESDAVDVVAYINPLQDLHEYDSPWPAGGGANLFPPYESVSVNGVTLTSDNGQVTLNGQATEDAWFDIEMNVFIPNGSTYYLCCFNPVATDSRVSLFAITNHGNPQKNMDVANGVTTGTVTEDTILSKFRLRAPVNVQLTNFKCSPMFQIGGTSPTEWTPYSNICPITGFTGVDITGTGKNLCALTDLTNIGWATENNGILSLLNSLPVGTYTFGFSIKLTAASKTGAWQYGAVFLNSVTNVTRWNNVSTDPAVNYVNTFYVSFSITSEMVGKFTHAYVYGCGSNGQGEMGKATLSNIQLELGSTPSSYAPYTGQTYPITFPSEAGTVYGGYVNVTQGKLVVDHGIHVFNGTDLNGGTGSDTIYIPLEDLKSGSWYSDPDTICDRLKKNPNNSGLGVRVGANDSQVYFNGFNTAYGISTLQALNEWFEENPVTLIYPLATPIEYDLTPQQIALLLGENNLWHDANGDTDVSYMADTKLYIEQLTKPTEDDMVANTNIASGKFFMIGNRLFLSTTAIASGATIVPGTNCTELSLADALNNLNA